MGNIDVYKRLDKIRELQNEIKNNIVNDNISRRNYTNYEDGISIIIPSYKGEKYIINCLESIKNQSINKKLYEVLIVINGEKDSTEKKVLEYIDKNNIDNFYVTYINNSSAGNARNIGIKLAKRKYITFIDDDDYISSNFLEKLYNNADDNRIVISQIVNVDCNGEKDEMNLLNSQVVQYGGEVLNPLKNINMMLSVNACKLIPTRCLKNMKYDTELRSGEDVVFYCELVLNNYLRYYVIPKDEDVIYYRVLRENSISRKSMSFQFNIIERLEVIERLKRFLNKKISDERRRFVIQKINGQAGFINKYLKVNPNEKEKVIKEIEKYDSLPISVINKNINGEDELHCLYYDYSKINENKEIINKDIERSSDSENLCINTKIQFKDESEVCIYKDIDKNIEVKKEDYQFNLFKNINYCKDDWFSDVNEIEFYNKEIICKDEKGYYISYKEKNNIFARIPTESNLKIENNKEYKFIMNGTSNNKKVCLYIIPYGNGVRKNAYCTELNNEIVVNFDKDVEEIRLAVKCIGSGKLKIDEIKIFKRNKLKSLDIKNYRKLGYDLPKTLKELKVAAICDEFTYEALKEEVKLITFTPYDWRAALEINKPHILLVESVWVGKEGTWSKKIGSVFGEGLEYFKEITTWCKENNIPTVFWNKEDPIHYKVFINAAKMCDFIYTTDRNMVDNYKKEVKHNNVGVIQFFARPKIHNPIKFVKEREKSVCFAGSYYSTKFLERQEGMDKILDIANELNLVIYDRHYGENNTEYEFPDKFKKYIVGKLPPSEIVKAYKKYKFLVNVNSVVDSPTMFSRRVFEGLACGTPVISTYSEAIKNTFKDIVILDEDYDKLKNKFVEIINNNRLYDEIKIKGIREVHSKYTVKNIMLKICRDVGININFNNNKIGIIAVVNNDEEMDKFKEILRKQTYKNIKGLAITNNCVNKYEDIICVKDEILFMQEIYKMDYISIINLKNYYGKNYIKDFDLATEYCESNILGKSEYNILTNEGLSLINKDESYQYVDDINRETLFINTMLFSKYDYNEVLMLIKKGEIKELRKYGERIYSIDKYNFISGCENNNVYIKYVNI